MFLGSYFWSDLSVPFYQVEPYAVAVCVHQTWKRKLGSYIGFHPVCALEVRIKELVPTPR